MTDRPLSAPVAYMYRGNTGETVCNVRSEGC